MIKHFSNYFKIFPKAIAFCGLDLHYALQGNDSRQHAFEYYYCKSFSVLYCRKGDNETFIQAKASSA